MKESEGKRLVKILIFLFTSLGAFLAEILYTAGHSQVAI